MSQRTTPRQVRFVLADPISKSKTPVNTTDDPRRLFALRDGVIAEMERLKQKGDASLLCDKASEFVRLTRTLYGPLSQETLYATCEYGLIQLDAGRVKDSHDTLGSLVAFINLHQLKHPEILANALLGLGNIFNQKGDNHEALRIYLQSIEAIRESKQNNTISTASVLLNIGLIYIHQDRFLDAIGVFQQALGMVQDYFGPSSKLLTSDICHNLGCCYDRLSNLPEAMKFYQRALCIRERELGPDDLACSDTRICLANVLKDMRKQKDAYNLLLHSCRVCEAQLGTQHPQTVEAYFYIGKLCLDMGDPHQAVEFLHKVVEGRVANLGDFHALTDEAILLHKRASLQAKQKKIRTSSLPRPPSTKKSPPKGPTPAPTSPLVGRFR